MCIPQLQNRREGGVLRWLNVFNIQVILMKIDVKFIGLDEVLAKISISNSNMKQASIKALNKTGYDAMDAVTAEMRVAFDRPTPYTLSSMRLDKAKPSKMYAELGPREWPGKGTPAEKYLAPEVWGGDRNLKRFESALRKVGVLPQDMYAVPGAGADIDAFGNMSRGQIVQIISWFQAFGEQGFRANMVTKTKEKLKRGSKKTGYGFEYFAIRRKGSRLPMGIYKRFRIGGGGILPVLIFVKKPHYQKRYKFFEVAHQVAMQMFPRHFFALLRGIKR